MADNSNDNKDFNFIEFTKKLENFLDKFQQLTNRQLYIEDGKIIQEQELVNKAQDLANAEIKFKEKKLEQDKNNFERYKEHLKDQIEFEKEQRKAYNELHNEVKYGDSRVGKAAAKIANMQNKANPKAEAVKLIGEVVGSGLNALADTAAGIQDWVLAEKKDDLRSSKNAFDKQQKLFQAHMEMSNVVANNVTQTISSMATQSAIQASRSIAEGAMTEANARIKLISSTAMAEKEFQVAEQEREVTKQKEYASAINKTVSGFGNFIGMLGPWGAAVGTIINVAAGIGTKINEMNIKSKEFDIERQKQENEMYQAIMGNITAIADKAQKFVGGIMNTANQVADNLMKNETLYKQMGVTMGFQGESYTKFMQKVQEGSSKYFNITAEQMKQMTDSYSTASGRNLIFNDNDYNQMTSMSRTYGVGQGEIASMLGEMNVFNTSISDGYDVMNDMWHIATKLGLSTSKFSKDLVQNLKLAQKYNFKGGVDNMAKLTMWANKVKFNLQNAVAFADKMMSNNISDVLETSAKLQVLGGNASIYADPMGMMWEAENDVGALAKRQYAMFGDITGTFNSKTGETSFSGYELRRIKEIAGAMGMNYEDVLNQKRLEGRQRVVNRELAGYGLDEDTLNGIAQRATYDKKRGSMIVKTLEGDKTIQELAGMSNQQRSAIMMPENQESAIMEVATNTRSLVERADTELAFWTATMAPKLWDTIRSTSEQQMGSQAELFNNGDFAQALNATLIGQTNLSTKQTSSTIKTLSENSKVINDYFKFAEQNVGREMAFNAMEIGLLSTIAGEGGIEKYSKMATTIASIANETDDKERESLIEGIRNSDEGKFMADLFFGPQSTTQDGYGFTNGGYIAGASVTPINDGRGSLVKTHPNDQFLAAKSGGPIDKLFDIVNSIITNNGVSGNGGKLNIEFTGNINLQDKSGNINLVEIMRKDPITAREFTRLIVKTMDSSSNGKVSQNYYI